MWVVFVRLINHKQTFGLQTSIFSRERFRFHSAYTVTSYHRSQITDRIFLQRLYKHLPSLLVPTSVFQPPCHFPRLTHNCQSEGINTVCCIRSQIYLGAVIIYTTAGLGWETNIWHLTEMFTSLLERTGSFASIWPLKVDNMRHPDPPLVDVWIHPAQV